MHPKYYASIQYTQYVASLAMARASIPSKEPDPATEGLALSASPKPG